MLVIKGIKIKFDRRVIPLRIRKIAVGYGKQSMKTKKKYLQVDTHTFEWNQDITVPLYYNVPLTFLCRVDQNDCNPENGNAELSSIVKIVDYKGTSQEASIINLQNKKVGQLYLTYRVSNQRIGLPEEKGVAVISSILAHLNHYKGARGYIEISLGHKQLFTPTVNVIAGELLWAQQLLLPIEQIKSKGTNKQKIVFTVFIEEQPRGKGSFQIEPLLKSQIKYKKFDILNIGNQTQKIGTLFIDIVFRQRNSQGNTIQTNPTIQKTGSSVSLFKKKPESALDFHSYPSQNFFNSNSKLQPSNPINTPMRSNRSESRLGHHYDSQATLSILQKYEQKKKKNQNQNLFEGIFNIGELNKEQSIRNVLKQRRKKNKNEGSLPKLK